VAALVREDRHLPICSAPSIHILHYLPCNYSAILSYIILNIIFPSSLGKFLV